MERTHPCSCRIIAEVEEERMATARLAPAPPLGCGAAVSTRITSTYTLVVPTAIRSRGFQFARGTLHLATDDQSEALGWHLLKIQSSRSCCSDECSGSCIDLRIFSLRGWEVWLSERRNYPPSVKPNSLSSTSRPARIARTLLSSHAISYPAGRRIFSLPVAVKGGPIA